MSYGKSQSDILPHETGYRERIARVAGMDIWSADILTSLSDTVKVS